MRKSKKNYLWVILEVEYGVSSEDGLLDYIVCKMIKGVRGRIKDISEERLLEIVQPFVKRTPVRNKEFLYVLLREYGRQGLNIYLQNVMDNIAINEEVE